MADVTLASAWFDTPGMLLAGAATGLVFGFLLQKGGVSRFSVIVDQLRLKDFTVAKVMVTAIVVGALGIFGMRALGMEFPMHVKATLLGGVVGGGLVFGVGMALLGYCPGTAFAALGDGSRHAWFGVFGMLAGAAVYAEVFPWLNERLLARGDFGKATLDSLAGVSPWLVVVPLAVATVGVFWWMERSRRTAAGV